MNASAAAKTALTNLSNALFTGYPGGGLRARVTSLDVYAPPYVQVGGTWTRFGLATVKVVAQIYQGYPDGSEKVLAERSACVGS